MAFDELLDEHEQGRLVQNWLRKNGPAIALGLAVGLGGLAAWSWYQGHQVDKSKTDANNYTQALTAIDTDPKTADSKIAAIDTPAYRNLAKLHLAKAQAASENVAGAIATLKSISSKDPEINELVAVRLGRLEIDSGKPKDAIALLKSKSTPEALEVLGDAYFADKQVDTAQKTYQQALAKLDAASAQRPIVELKLTEAGGTPAAKPEVKTQ